jgi:hypothetical protein
MKGEQSMKTNLCIQLVIIAVTAVVLAGCGSGTDPEHPAAVVEPAFVDAPVLVAEHSEAEHKSSSVGEEKTAPDAEE